MIPLASLQSPARSSCACVIASPPRPCCLEPTLSDEAFREPHWPPLRCSLQNGSYCFAVGAH
eukprot:scaffold287_cov239-Pinguiococcus_pyrenoidosus.AAC.11